MAVDGPDGRPATFHAAKHWGNRDVIEKLRRARYDFDEEKLRVAYNDVDYCLRAGAAGFRTVVTPQAVLSWRWRVDKLVDEADLKVRSGDD